MVYSSNGILYSLPKWTNSAAYNYIDNPHKHNIEWRNLNVKLNIVYGFIYIMFKTVKLIPDSGRRQNSSYL